eukprot:TRINITY_DN2453_c0_g1_i4.p1 TRINITY_DN2453_c0_g1~~TRINITY_DN2453_c0_g1_i4.p1  ORF type:complete len:163 (-),score=7.84 TRINITY_DN2453_c0_g1_i4:155-592(-)
MYPSRVVEASNSKMKCLFTTRIVQPGEIVQKVRGPLVQTYDNVPEEEKCHAMLVDWKNDVWCLIQSDARYINHSCDPNCFVDDDLNIVCLREIPPDTEISFRYNDCTPEEANQEWFWDPRWSFDCLCGSSNCIGRLNRYHAYDRT